MAIKIISQLAQRFLAWHLKPSDSPNFDFLDGLRGIAILLVVGSHLVYTNPASSIYVRFVGEIFEKGGCGVALFFCLSGFLVSLPFWKQKKLDKGMVMPRGYIQRRFFKIYPPLALTLVVFTPIYIYLTHDVSYLTTCMEWLVGVPLLFPVDGGFNPVMWSLIVEIQFYIALPLIMYLFRKISISKSLTLIPLSFVLAGFFCRNAFGLFGIHGTIHPNIYSPPFSGLDLFALGVLVAGLTAMGLVTKPLARAGSVGLLVVIVLFPIMAYVSVTQQENEPYQLAVDTVLHVAFGCMLCFIGDGECYGARLLCNPLLRWFGIVSYEWYLLHQAFFIWIRGAIGQANGNFLIYLLIIGGSFLSSLIAAALLYKFFSLPILKYARASR